MTIKAVDDFVDVSGWQAIVSGRAELRLAADTGPAGPAMRLDFDFKGGGGFVVARRLVHLTLPPAYCFCLAVRGAIPSNRFELKLVDPGGTNVWRYQSETLAFDADWRTLEIPSRQIDFAWGPAGGGAASEVGAVEIAIVAGSGGRGQLWVSDLSLQDRTPPWPPRVLVSSVLAGHEPRFVFDGRSDTDWCAAPGRGEAWLTMDLHRECEYGGLILRWADTACERAFRVQASADGDVWEDLYSATAAAGPCNFVGLQNATSRFLRLGVDPGADGRYPALVAVELQPDAFSRSINELFQQVAGQSVRGRYPRWLYREQTYWTSVDIPDGVVPALFNEDGLIEVGRARWSLEPFLYSDGSLSTWHELASIQTLELGELPIPAASGAHNGISLTTTAYAAGPAEQRVLYARYRVESRRETDCAVRLFVAVRPFQVSPPWQGFDDIGGVSRVRQLAYRDGTVWVNEAEAVIPLCRASGFGAAAFDQGPITDYLARGALPARAQVSDHFGYASGALRFDLMLPPCGIEEVVLAVPFDPATFNLDAAEGSPVASLLQLDGTAGFAEAVRGWSQRLGAVCFDLPLSARDLATTAKTALAHLLVNRDGPALQPGPRRYTRSWIRDGAVMSAALLRLGCTTEAVDFIRWYAGFQAEDGEVPCCVDHNGPDWLAEHDSLGELIFAVAEPVRFAGDRQLAADLWPAVLKAVSYLEQLRARRLTADDLTPERLPCFGLLPESVSHEGYLAQPVHAYWDDLWAVRGLKDAAWLAKLLGEELEHERLTRLCDDFRATLYASIERTMSERGIDFIPGSVEWADADPTAIAVALTLIDETPHLPARALARTFDLFLDRFRAMHGHRVHWTNYSPYEIRVAGALLRLGRRDEVHELLRVLFADRRPPAWHQWPEIIWRDPRAPGHQGDLPHAWISAEYILVFRDLFAYEREVDQSLVVCQGVTREWLAEGPVGVAALPTWYGRLDLSLCLRADETIELRLTGTGQLPPGGIRFVPPGGLPPRSVWVNGVAATEFTSTEVVIRSLPAVVVVA